MSIAKDILNYLEAKAKESREFKEVVQWGVLPTCSRELNKCIIKDVANEKTSIDRSRVLTVEVTIFARAIDRVRELVYVFLEKIENIEFETKYVYRVDFDSYELNREILSEDISVAKLLLKIDYTILKEKF